MVKRARSESEASDHDGGIAVTRLPRNLLTDVAVLQSLTRMILARHSRTLKLRKEHFGVVLRQLNVKGNINPYIELIQVELRNVFGFTVDQVGGELCVKDVLDDSSKNLLSEILESEIPMARSSLHEKNFHMSHRKRQQSIVNTSDSMISGITILVICLTVVNENRIRECDLQEYLETFGLPNNLNLSIANLNRTTQEVLADIVRKEYLQRLTLTQEGGSALSEYTLGKKALREIPPQMIVEFLFAMHDLDEMRQKCIKTVNQCFPDVIISAKDINQSE